MDSFFFAFLIYINQVLVTHINDLHKTDGLIVLININIYCALSCIQNITINKLTHKFIKL